MSYLVYARKFRPQAFDEIVGQQPIVTTLQNAIRQNRIPQSFLFSGPRGIGKTTTARVLAKALNCEKGPTDNPCGKCISCTEITQGTSLDVLEIDGASNRGIDEIRNLRETVKFKPVSGRVKIYIIDEVHMLTTEAFNALLKTLEEPPPHVKFVFATTEAHKVPLTILSRCQRFHFKRIPTADIVEKLAEIVKKEKLKADKKTLFQIAKASDGALRDAEGLLDQLASFAGEKITEEDVLMALGLTGEEIYFELLNHIQSKDAQKVFELIESLYENGKDFVVFAKGLLEIFRHLLLVQCTDKADKFIELSEEGIRELKKRKDVFSKSELLLAMNILCNLQVQLRRNTAPPRLLLEMTALKLIHLDGMRNVEEVVQELNGPRQGKVASGLSAGYSTPKPQNIPVPPKPSLASAEAPAVSQPLPKANQPVKMGSGTIDQIEAFWPKIIEYVKSKRMSTGIFLSESEPVEVSDSAVTLGLPQEFQFHKETLERDSNLSLVKEAFEVVTSQKWQIRFVITQADRISSKIPETPPAQAKDSAALSDILTQALDVFDGAKIIRQEG